MPLWVDSGSLEKSKKSHLSRLALHSLIVVLNFFFFDATLSALSGQPMRHPHPLPSKCPPAENGLGQKLLLSLKANTRGYFSAMPSRDRSVLSRVITTGATPEHSRD